MTRRDPKRLAHMTALRHAGMSYQAIGTLYDVTRQATHQYLTGQRSNRQRHSNEQQREYHRTYMRERYRASLSHPPHPYHRRTTTTTGNHMPQPRKTPSHPLVVRIPRDLYDELRIVMLDPTTGHVRLGSWTRLMTGLLRDWLDTQKVPHP